MVNMHAFKRIDTVILVVGFTNMIMKSPNTNVSHGSPVVGEGMGQEN